MPPLTPHPRPNKGHTSFKSLWFDSWRSEKREFHTVFAWGVKLSGYWYGPCLLMSVSVWQPIHEVIHRDEDTKKIQNIINAGMASNGQNLQNYLSTWDNYREIWEIQKDAFIRRYQKLNPQVSSFDADIGRSVDSLLLWGVLFWFVADCHCGVFYSDLLLTAVVGCFILICCWLLLWGILFQFVADCCCGAFYSDLLLTAVVGSFILICCWLLLWGILFWFISDCCCWGILFWLLLFIILG